MLMNGTHRKRVVTKIIKQISKVLLVISIHITGPDDDGRRILVAGVVNHTGVNV